MLTRRSVFKGSLAVPLWYVQSASLLGKPAYAFYDEDCGVASGNPSEHSVVLWTRVPASGRRWLVDEFGGVPVSWEVSTSPGFEAKDIVVAGEAETSGERDYTVQVLAEGLEPFTTYYYRFRTPGGYESVVGRTKTAPPAGGMPSVLKIGAVSCQQMTAGYFSAYRHLINEDLDFCVHLGDHIYEKEPGRGGRGDPLGGREARTLADYRAKYRYYLSDPLLREARRLFAWIDIWDDHELVNDYAGETARRQDPARYAEGYQAFAEYMPIMSRVERTADGLPELRLYRSHAFGDLLELFVTDQRQYRTPNPCSRTFMTYGCDDLYDSRHTMLGKVQKTWLKEGLASSRARWKLMMSEVMVSPVKLGLFGIHAEQAAVAAFDDHAYLGAGGMYMNLDAWDGFPAERQELFSFLQDEGVKNVVILTGDIHAAANGYVYRDPEVIEGAPVAVEVVTTSITSRTLGDNLGSIIGGGVHALIKRSNRHLAWTDVSSHGYTVLEATPEAMHVRHVAVESIHRPDANARVVRQCVIPDGRAEFR